MATASVWSDSYDGDIHLYKSPLRPIPAYMLPEGSTIVLGFPYNEREIRTTAPLPEHFVSQWSLEEVTA